MNEKRFPRFGIYLGAFIGPFAGNVVTVFLPDLAAAYSVTPTGAATSISAYMLPFAIGQLLSGALADRVGARPVLIGGFIAIAAGGVAAAAAPDLSIHLAARALQGLGNACTTPLLMASLGDTVPPERLGRELGRFNAANTAGLFLAPLVGGWLAVHDWRLAFLCVTVASLTAAALIRPVARGPLQQNTQTKGHAARGSFPVKRLALLCVSGFLGYLSLNGVGFLIAVNAATRFDLRSQQVGLLLACLGLANVIMAAPAGRAVDRFGPQRVAACGAAVGGLVLALIPSAPTAAALAGLLAIGGAAVATLWAGLTALAVSAAPTRRATAISFFSAWRFIGYALAPVLYGPLNAEHGAQVAFMVAAGASTAIVAPLVLLRGARKEPDGA